MKKLSNVLRYGVSLVFLLLSIFMYILLDNYLSDRIWKIYNEGMREQILGIYGYVKKLEGAGGRGIELSDSDIRNKLELLHSIIPYGHMLVLDDKLLYYGRRDTFGNVLEEGKKHDIKELMYKEDILGAQGAGYGKMRGYERLEGGLESYIYYTLKLGKYYIRVGRSANILDEMEREYSKGLLLSYLLFLLIVLLWNVSFSSWLRRALKRLSLFTTRGLIRGGRVGRVGYDSTLFEEIYVVEKALLEIGHDIKKTFLELKRRNREIEAVVENVSEGVLILDEEGKVILCNRGMYNLLNIDKRIYGKGVEGRYYYEILRSNKLVRYVDEGLLKGRNIREEVHWQTLEEKVLDVSTICLLKRGGILMLVNDITEGYRSRELKRIFAREVTKALVEPLKVIEGNTKKLYKEGLLEEKEEILEGVQNNVELLSNFIRDFNILHKLDSGKNLFEYEKVNIVELIKEVVECLKGNGEVKGVRVYSKIEEDTIELKGDRELLYSIFYDVIDNGIKYTEEGEVRVEYMGREGKAIFSIIDTGVGIAKGEREKVVERFYKGGGGVRRFGTGLGLSIVKEGMDYYNNLVDAEGAEDGLLISDNLDACGGTEIRLCFWIKEEIEEG